MAGVEAHRTLTAFTQITAPVAGTTAGFYTLVPGANLVLFTYNSATATHAAYIKVVSSGLSDPPVGGDDSNPASAVVGDYHYKVMGAGDTVEITSNGRYEIEALSVWAPLGDSVDFNVVGMTARTGLG